MPDFAKAFTLTEDGRLIWKEPPPEHAEKVGREAGYICRGKGGNKDYWQVRLGGRTFKRSRVIFFMTHGHWPTPCVDHINGNSLDDRPANLREATYVQNGQNQRPRRGKASGLPQGVSPYRGRYRAQIILNKRRIVLGSFATPDEAAAAYQDARKREFGEYA